MPDEVIDRYLRLGLRLGRHVDGLVDAYVGPPELAAEVEAEPPSDPRALADEASSLLAALETADGFDERRRGWLADQLGGLATYARVLAGDAVPYADEVEGCYGVRPGRTDESALARAQERLGVLLPGRGPLAERYAAWRRAQIVPVDRIEPIVAAAVAELRAWTAEIVELPEGDSVVVESVTDEPWLAFNYYEGGFASRVAVNRDLPVSATHLLTLAAHETYPGHHAERACKEEGLVRARGLLEESIVLVPTPQSLVAEGIAEVGVELALGGTLGPRLEAIVRDSVPGFDLEHSLAVMRAHEALSAAAVDADLLLHEDGATHEAVRDYLMHWLLEERDRAEKSVAFLTDPTSRGYVITYVEGVRLCRAFVAGDPGAHARLLTEQVRVGDLLAAA